MNNEIKQQLITIAKNNELIVHKIFDGSIFFSTGYITPNKIDKPFYGCSFNLYEYKFYDLCKSLKLII